MAKIIYTFEDYINNPSGRGSAVHGMINLEQYKTELLGLESRNGKSRYTVYSQNKEGQYQYIIHFNIPSSTNGFFHDVVIEFNPNKNDSTSSKTIKKHNVKFFANDSNFVFSFAYTFKSHGLLIKELERYLPFRCLAQKPHMRNPDNAMGRVKTIIFAYIVMMQNDLFNKDNLNRICKNAGYNTIKTNLDTFDNKEKERRKMTQEAKEAGKNKNPTKIIKSKNLLGDSLPIPKVSKIVGRVKSVSKTSSVKKSKRK